MYRQQLHHVCRLSRLQYSYEQLEPRLALTASATVALEQDSGVSATDVITNNAALVGSLSEPLSLAFDHNSDGIAECQLDLFGQTYRYDPISHDGVLQHFEGLLSMRTAIGEWDELGNVSWGAWNSFTYTLDNVAPQWSSNAAIEVQQNTPTITVNLNELVSDGITSDANLQLAILSNSDPSLFSSATINTSHELVLQYAGSQLGSAVLTLMATDEAGNSQTYDLQVNRGNAAPMISFSYQLEADRIVTLSGTVTDDASVAGLTVSFGGVLAQYGLTATVQADGTFSVTAQLFGIQSGTATALTHDVQGLASNTATINLEVPFVLGDMNGDGRLNNFDIQPFETAITNPQTYLAAYPYMASTYQNVGDINGDGRLNNFDIQPFCDLLTA